MNENQDPDAPLDETDTSDVRAAIERAKENLRLDEEQTGQVGQAAQVGQAEEETFIPAAAPTPDQVPIDVLPPQPVLGAHEAQPVTEAYIPAEQAPAAAPITPQPQIVNIPTDHPMAPLYIQQPMPPTPKANRLGGVLISLLGTLAFSLVYAGALAVILAPKLPPSTFLQQGLLPHVTSLGFVLPIVAFFVVMVILVLIFNRAGWWVYAVLGVVVALAVWAAAGVGYALSPQLLTEPLGGIDTTKDFNLRLFAHFVMTLPAVVAAFVAREVTIWFGAWIGSRGRKVKQANLVRQQEYQQKLAEVQAQVS